MNKKGNYESPFIILALVLIAIIFFGLFVVMKTNLAKKISYDWKFGEFTEKEGSFIIRSYLITPLDVDASRYEGDRTLAALSGTMMDALPRVLTECADDAESGFCKLFIDRTALFLNSTCKNDSSLAFLGEGSVQVGKGRVNSASFNEDGYVAITRNQEEGIRVVGEQSFPSSEGPITVKLECTLIYGVDS